MTVSERQQHSEARIWRKSIFVVEWMYTHKNIFKRKSLCRQHNIYFRSSMFLPQHKKVMSKNKLAMRKKCWRIFLPKNQQCTACTRWDKTTKDLKKHIFSDRYLSIWIKVKTIMEKWKKKWQPCSCNHVNFSCRA